jgi:peptidoglycan/LPS O-acetylase OafA/YrhL
MTAVRTTPLGNDAPQGPIALRHLPSLNGLRGLFTLEIFLAHAWTVADLFHSETARQKALVLVPVAMALVSWFFILSGFLLTWSARPEEPARSFWWRRFLKIYPSHFVVWAALALFLGITGTAVLSVLDDQGFTWGPALANLFLVNSWLNEPHYTAGINIVCWSLVTEQFFYLLFPVLLPWVRRLRPERLWLVAGLMLLAVWTVPVVALQFGGEQVIGANVGKWQFWIAYFCPLSRVPEFILGMVLARIVQSGKSVPLGMTASAVLLLVCQGAAMVLLPFPFLPAAAAVVPAALLTVAAATADLRERPSWLRRPTLVFLGDLSFAIYLVHWPVLLVTNWLTGNRPWGTPIALAVTLLTGAVVLLVAWLLHTRVERPMVRRFGGRAPREHPVTTPQPTPVETVAL